MPPLSTLYSTRPAFTSRTARSRSKVIVPDLGFGIRPRRPRMRPSLPTWPIMSGVARATSNSSQPASIRLTMSSAPTSSAPARMRLLGLVALGEHEHAHLLADTVRQDDGAANHLVGVTGIHAEANVGLDGRVEVDLGRVAEQLSSRVGLRRPSCGRRARTTPCSASRDGASCVFLRVGPVGPPPFDPWGERTGAATLPGRRQLRRRSSAPEAQPLTSIPIERAVPSMMRDAPSRSMAFRSAILVWAISRTWRLRDRPGLLPAGRASRPSRRRRPCAAGPRRAASSGRR